MAFYKSYVDIMFPQRNKLQQQVTHQFWLVLIVVLIMLLMVVILMQLDIMIILSCKNTTLKDCNSDVPLSGSSVPSTRSEADTVVLYVFGGNDPFYQGNLFYFLLHGILPNVDYVIVLQDGWAKVSETIANELRRVPSNVQIVTHPNQCYDWGTFGWYLQNHLQQLRSNYTYIIFVNSSIRGPFYTAYEEQDWVTIMKEQLNMQEDVKVFGASINCELYAWNKIKPRMQRYNPHVQSYLMIMDFKTLDILFRDPYVFQCHKELQSAIHYAELGSSLKLLEAGYNIGTSLLRYQGIDWRKKVNWKCNGNKNPTKAHYYDGINMPPLETMFVKVKSEFQGTRSVPIRLSLWQELIRNKAMDPNTSSSIEQKNYLFGFKEIYFHKKQHCWDVIYYQLQNQDLTDKGIFYPQQLWEHFINEGYLQGRDYRFAC